MTEDEKKKRLLEIGEKLILCLNGKDPENEGACIGNALCEAFNAGVEHGKEA